MRREVPRINYESIRWGKPDTRKAEVSHCVVLLLFIVVQNHGGQACSSKVIGYNKV